MPENSMYTIGVKTPTVSTLGVPGRVESRAVTWGSCTLQIDSQVHGTNLLTGSSF